MHSTLVLGVGIKVRLWFGWRGAVGVTVRSMSWGCNGGCSVTLTALVTVASTAAFTGMDGVQVQVRKQV